MLRVLITSALCANFETDMRRFADSSSTGKKPPDGSSASAHCGHVLPSACAGSVGKPSGCQLFTSSGSGGDFGASSAARVARTVAAVLQSFDAHHRAAATIEAEL